MRDVNDVLGGVRVPDPGEGYWDFFSRRVDAMLPPSGTSFRSNLLRKTALFAASAAAGLLIAFVAASMTGDGLPTVSPAANPVVAESRVTVTLSSEVGSPHPIVVLSDSAIDKISLAKAARSEGRWDSIAPLARSYEKILNVGIVSTLERAEDDDEDIEQYLDKAMAAASEGAECWRLISASADTRFAGDAASALEASENLAKTLDERFGKSRG